MQAELSLAQTGNIAFGDVMFLPGKSVVDTSSSPPNPGLIVTPNTILGSLTPIEQTKTHIGKNGNISTTNESLQRVSTNINVSDKNLINIGSEVRIELPDESVLLGSVIKIGSVAVIPQNNQSDPYLEVSIAFDGDKSVPEWTGAPTTVSVTKDLAKNVLATPVTSLLALLGGGYALEILDGNSLKLVPVETGIYADGWVQIVGSDLKAGDKVVVAR